MLVTVNPHTQSRHMHTIFVANSHSTEKQNQGKERQPSHHDLWSPITSCSCSKREEELK